MDGSHVLDGHGEFPPLRPIFPPDVDRHTERRQKVPPLLVVQPRQVPSDAAAPFGNVRKTVTIVFDRLLSLAQRRVLTFEPALLVSQGL